MVPGTGSGWFLGQDQGSTFVRVVPGTGSGWYLRQDQGGTFVRVVLEKHTRQKSIGEKVWEEG